ncbi:hypothetical protein ACFO3A_15245 [Comamonas nitrativorans]|jgi:hypothetical protein|uniref:Uncharacterized protein n=1 Tax=Comamonas nitrativorans TaxID=108437 RepID=A0ABV9H2B3_9BURK|nr:hypothetical protein [Comamonas sp.]
MPQRDSLSPSTLWGLSIAAMGLALIAGWGYIAQREQLQQERALRAQQAAYAVYERSTRAEIPSAAQNAAQQERLRRHEEARQVRQTLLQHPNVTPGPGFNAPGVQTTGLAIVEAIDRAQGQ